jgi:hypothetical protein
MKKGHESLKERYPPRRPATAILPGLLPPAGLVDVEEAERAFEAELGEHELEFTGASFGLARLQAVRACPRSDLATFGCGF